MAAIANQVAHVGRLKYLLSDKLLLRSVIRQDDIPRERHLCLHPAYTIAITVKQLFAAVLHCDGVPRLVASEAKSDFTLNLNRLCILCFNLRVTLPHFL
jgi:hypothetical protein